MWLGEGVGVRGPENVERVQAWQSVIPVTGAKRVRHGQTEA